MGGDPVRHRQGRADPGQHQPGLPAHELEYALNKVGCRALVTATSFKTSDYLGHAAPSWRHARAPGAQGCRCCETVIQIGGDRARHRPVRRDRGPAAPASSAPAWPSWPGTLQFDEPINIQFTSGTTGAPKGATLTHHNILNNGYFIGEAQKLGPDDKVCIPVPLYHCFGMVLGNLACITHGSAMVYPGGGFDPLAVLQTVHEERCTALYGVPTMFIAELGHPGVRDASTCPPCAPASWRARRARSR